jgi:tetraacyldisaccharide 4'-kinase
MNLLERTWYRATPAWSVIAAALLPLAGIFALVSGLRRRAYRAGWLRTTSLRVPVIVVGNLTVGGTGKTPLVLWLAHALRRRGYTPGILSRGYGANPGRPLAVGATATAAGVGDEPLLLARASGCPVWVGADRAAAGAALLAAHPRCDVLIADDGLQHYRLARRTEIAVVDGDRGFGNGLPLPAGPLREPVARLERVDAVVINAAALDDPDRTLAAGRPAFAMAFAGTRLRNLVDPTRVGDLASLRGTPVHAVAGIGNPRRFFDQLARQGLHVTRHPFPDHHAYRAEELDFGDDAPILMTEKDAVKCASFARVHWWALETAVRIEPGLDELVIARLQRP